MVQRYTIIYAHKIYKDLSVFYQDARSIIEILINRAKRPAGSQKIYPNHRKIQGAVFSVPVQCCYAVEF